MYCSGTYCTIGGQHRPLLKVPSYEGPSFDIWAAIWTVFLSFLVGPSEAAVFRSHRRRHPSHQRSSSSRRRKKRSTSSSSSVEDGKYGSIMSPVPSALKQALMENPSMNLNSCKSLEERVLCSPTTGCSCQSSSCSLIASIAMQKRSHDSGMLQWHADWKLSQLMDVARNPILKFGPARCLDVLQFTEKLLEHCFEHFTLISLIETCVVACVATSELRTELSFL